MDRRTFLEGASSIIALKVRPRGFALLPLPSPPLVSRPPESDIEPDDECGLLAKHLREAGIESLLKQASFCCRTHWSVKRMSHYHDGLAVFLDVFHSADGEHFCYTKNIAITRRQLFGCNLEIGPELARRLIQELKARRWKAVGWFDIDDLEAADLTSHRLTTS